MRSIVLVLLAGVVLAGCAGESQKGTVPPKDEQGRYVIELTSANLIVPRDARVPVGSTVVWKVGPGGFHDVTSDAGAPEQFSSDTKYPGKMREGQEFEYTFQRPGTYAYRCAVHAAMMQGQLVVE